MDEHQLVCYPRSGTCSLLKGKCLLCSINFFSLFNILSKFPKLTLLLPLKGLFN